MRLPFSRDPRQVIDIRNDEAKVRAITHHIEGGQLAL